MIIYNSFSGRRESTLTQLQCRVGISLVDSGPVQDNN